VIIAWLLLKSNDFIVKRVKTALLFNDKYKQGYSYIMSQYTSSDTAAQGAVVNAVLDTASNTITYTVTGARGLTATVTLPASQNPQQGVTVINDIRRQFAAQNGGSFLNLGIGGFGDSLNAVWGNVTQQAEKATVTSEATGNPPPAETQPIPVSTTTNPSPTPAPDTTTTPTPQPNPNIDPNTNIGAEIQTPTPQPNPNIDPNTNIGAEIQTPTPQPNPNIDPNTNIGAEIQTPTPQPNPNVDEFAGIDEQVRQQQTINPNSDPNTNIGAEIQTPYNVAIVPTIDDGSDPYVSNGTTTIEPTNQLAAEDPYEAARLAAEGNFNTEPSYDFPPPDNTTYYENNGESSNSVTSPNSVTENVFDPTGNNGAPQTEENVFDPTGNNGAPRGLSTSLQNTRSQATQQDESNFQAKPDWRVRLSLAPGATYLYKNRGKEGILLPLAATDGVIFPYTPNISVSYAANYDNSELTHSNYKFWTYRASSVDSISINCDFTAQDTFEANYLLAVIHFFRSVTKMFYGQDQNPKIGTPPPLCYLSGLGAFQFDAHPLAITAFNYSLPTDVDYIRAGSTPTPAGVNRSASNVPLNSGSVSNNRLNSQGLNQGGLTAPPNFNPNGGTRDVTYVPTKMSISISAIPIVTRNDISNKFSLTEYGTGKLLRGTQRQGGGIW
jgi:hypothetical protein